MMNIGEKASIDDPCEKLKRMLETPASLLPGTVIKENSTNKEQDLKYFMEIAYNAGLNVFEIDSNFNTFTQITLNNNQITRTECK